MGKGSNNERAAHELLQRAGYAPYRPATVRFGENDVWGMFDVLAVSPDDRPERLVQVKSNRVSPTAYFRKAWLWATETRTVELWTKYDREGWRVMQYALDPSDAAESGNVNGRYFNAVDERKDERVQAHAHSELNLGDGVVEWLERSRDPIEELNEHLEAQINE
jgi:hypothetical protein